MRKRRKRAEGARGAGGGGGVCVFVRGDTGGGYDRVSSPGSRADADAPVGLLADPGDGRRK